MMSRFGPPDNVFLTEPCNDGGWKHSIKYVTETRARVCIKCHLTDHPSVAVFNTESHKAAANKNHTLGKRKPGTKQGEPFKSPSAVNKKNRIAERDGFKGCRYCGYYPRAVHTLSIEHLNPITAPEGSNELWNLGLACVACNNLKGPLTEEEFILWILTGRIPNRLPREGIIGFVQQEPKRLTMEAGFMVLLDYLEREGLPLHRGLPLATILSSA